jgi:H-type lectin domain
VAGILQDGRVFFYNLVRPRSRHVSLITTENAAQANASKFTVKSELSIQENYMKWITIFSLAAFLPFASAAEDCESVIALSKTNESKVYDQRSIEQQAANFCSEYGKSIRSGSSMDAGGSYGLFSASVGMSNQSSSAIASKYCSSSNDYSASQIAYKSYVESISPMAYSAYQRCLEMSRKELKFSVDSAAILPAQFTATVSFSSTNYNLNRTNIEITPSDGITCLSDGQTATIIEIASGSTRSITCKRSTASSPGYIRFVNRDSSSTVPLTLPWRAYTDEGAPKLTMLELQKRLERIENSPKVVTAASGTIGLRAVGTRPITDTSACPAGSGAFRGEMQGRVEFETAFVDPPAVAIGLTSVDTALPNNTGLRLVVNVVEGSITRTGFEYKFFTWCNTSIVSANASWIAVAQ